MEFVKGLVVRSLAGHDKGGFFTVLSVSGGTAAICDGKRRCLAKLKTKKQKHLAVTGTVLAQDSMETDRQIRAALRPFNGKGPAQEEA